MKEILALPGFWAFLGVLGGGVRYLIRVIFISKSKTNREKASLDASVERIKADTAIKIATSLKEVVDKIKPLVEQHELAISQLNHSIIQAGGIEKDMTKMMLTLQVYYDNFQSRMNQVHAGGELIKDRLEKMETEIKQMKNGNVFIRNKK